MCAAVAFDVRPLNVMLSWMVWATGSSTIIAKPVPGLPVAGFSFAPDSTDWNVIGAADKIDGRHNAITKIVILNTRMNSSIQLLEGQNEQQDNSTRKADSF